ncbi:glycosyltransferase family A protein [Sporosarcina sp. FSL K6-1540]|uniref:glycosyltransferase family A protein n=1 Tax=Sporosarcina sp. FSL K6-1540 TaxID=2921555 RepID=UPI003159CA7A
MKEIAIVAIAYNRPVSLKRLLQSLDEVSYDDKIKVPLIISIDWSENRDSVYEVAEKFTWEYGPEKIIKHKENLGLKKHIMFCGDLTKEYEALAVFEDDIYVSKGFYKFGLKAIEYYGNSEKVSGISLYTPEWNQTANRFFSVEQNEYDTFLMQYAQSWGQIWTRNWWSNFKQWFEEENNNDFNKETIPYNVQAWPDNSSWLKYYIKYCIEKDKYFVYPKLSYSTNFSEVGEHNSISTPSYQVSLFHAQKSDYIFQPEDDNTLNYDAFFEREHLSQYLNCKEEELCVDLYGTKKNSKRYLLTTQILNYETVKSFGMKLRPHELNVIRNIEGQEIHFYDTHKIIKRTSDIKKKRKYINIYLSLYDIRATSRKNLILLTLEYLKLAIYNKIRLFRGK